IRMMFDRTERQPAHGSHKLLELAGDAGVDRPMTRIVRARRDLVDEKLTTLGEKHFDRKEANEIELFGDVARDPLRPFSNFIREARWRDRHVEDVVYVPVFDRRVGRPGPDCSARDNYRDLAGEIDKALKDANLAAHLPPGFVDVGFRRQRHLTLTV